MMDSLSSSSSSSESEFSIPPLTPSEELDFMPLLRNLFFCAKNGFFITLVSSLNSVKDRTTQIKLANHVFTMDSGESCTLLTAAALNGMHDTVYILITKFKADVEKLCTIDFEGRLVHGVTALWCAASTGYLDIVKLLVAHGANINHISAVQSTPLRAACYGGRLDIVRYLVFRGANVNVANIFNNTCLMIASYKGTLDTVNFLLQNGADPDVQALCGATALHYATECDHFYVCKSLLDHNAKLLKNEVGLTPVLLAAERTNETLLEMFLFDERLALTVQDKIDAYELIGASFATDKNSYSIEKAFKYLMLGMKLRYENPNNVIKKGICPTVPAYENWVESQTIQDLQAIRLNNNSIHMESLAIRERILSKKNPNLLEGIVYRGAIYADRGRYDRCESLWVYALELRQSNNMSAKRDLSRLVQLINRMLALNMIVNPKCIIQILEACKLEINRSEDKTGSSDSLNCTPIAEYEENVYSALNLISISARALKTHNDLFKKDDLEKIYKLVYDLNKEILFSSGGLTLLHLAASALTTHEVGNINHFSEFPCYETVKLLLYCGADVRVVDFCSRSPLHLLASTVTNVIYPEKLNEVENIIKILLEYGTHIDAVNYRGETARTVCVQPAIKKLIRDQERKLFTLQCLSAQAIVRYDVPYRDIVPPLISSFIDLHNICKIKTKH